MKLFNDQKQEITILDFGNLPAGESKDYIFYVENDSKADLIELIFSVDNQELKINEAPIEILAEQTEKLIINWSPSITLKQGLKANLFIKGKELWR
jgi:hypothetical protein